MSMTIRDAENSWLISKQTWETFLAEFDMKWYGPAILESLVQSLQSLPPEVLEQLPSDTKKRISKMTLRGG